MVAYRVALVMSLGLWCVACDEEAAPPAMSSPREDLGVEDTPADPDAAGDLGQDDADLPSPARLEPRGDAPFAERHAPMLTCLEGALADTIATGAVVGVMEDGEVVWQGAYGVKAEGSEEPVGVETLFRFGSILKMMTATAALSLVDEGALSLEADVRAQVPALELAALPGGGLTLHRLLSHQGGMVDELSFQGPADDAGLRDFLTSADFLDIAFHAPPGSFYNYANPNFSLAGLLIEDADGAPYREAMARRVFSPLGMSRTMFRAEDVLADGDYARGTLENLLGVRAVTPDEWENTWARPAGLGWTSMADLLRFGRFLMQGDDAVLSPARWAMLRSPQVNTQESAGQLSYGYGVSVQRGVQDLDGQWRDVEILAHDGSTLDFNSLLITIPESGFAVAVLVNGPSDPVVGCALLSLQGELSRYPTREAPPGAQPDPAGFAAYAGPWQDTVEGPAGAISITLGPDGALLLQVPDWDAEGFSYEPALVPTTRDNFLLVFEGGVLPLTGIRGEDGALRYLRSRVAVFARAEAQGKPVAPSRAWSQRLRTPSPRPWFTSARR